MIADLGGLGSVAARASWAEVEQVLEARFEWERLPLEPHEGGAVHVGALDAMAGLPFRVVAIPGLVEGGYPGVFRPDPFLLDSEREALRAMPTESGPVSRERFPAGALGIPRHSLARTRELKSPQGLLLPALSLPVLAKAPSKAGRPFPSLLTPPCRERRSRTAQDRLLEARRLFHRALSQATERLILSYPRADARTGRERLPSLFFAAAASTLAGRPLAGAELERLVVEDDLDRLPLEDAVDAGERDRIRLRRDESAATAIAAGSAFFRQSRLASQARWSGRLTRYDGLVVGEGTRTCARGSTRWPRATRSRPAASPPTRAAASSTCCRTCCASSPRPSPRSGGGSTRSSAATSSTAWPSGSCASGATAASCRCATPRPRARGSRRWPRRRSRAWSRAARRASRCCGSGRSAASTRPCRAGWGARRPPPRGRPPPTSR